MPYQGPSETGQPHGSAIKSLVIGVGNAYRQDDGVGLFVANRIKSLRFASVDVLANSGKTLSLMEQWAGYAKVFLCDAVFLPHDSGKILRLNVSSESFPAGWRSFSTHSFNLIEAIHLARVLGKLPPALVVYGITGKQFGFGTSLSPAVRLAAIGAADRILAEIDAECHQAACSSSSGVSITIDSLK